VRAVDGVFGISDQSCATQAARFVPAYGAGLSHMKTSECSGSYPSPLWGGCKGGLRLPSLKRTPMLRIGYAEGPRGGGKPRRKPCLWQPESELRSSRPPRPPLPDDAEFIIEPAEGRIRWHRFRSHSRCEASAFYLETAAKGRLCPPHKGEGSQQRPANTARSALQFRHMRLPSPQGGGEERGAPPCRA
jgi:hypothetical protein